MPNYQPADDDLDELVSVLLEKYRPDLAGAGVQVKTLLAYPTEKQMEAHQEGGDHEPPVLLRRHGYPALLVISVNSQKKRAEGCLDVTLAIDGDAWKAMGPDEQEERLHKAIQFLELQLKDGGLLTDDLGRPKLKLRTADVHVEEFSGVVRLHQGVGLREVEKVVQRHRDGEFRRANGFVVETAGLQADTG